MPSDSSGRYQSRFLNFLNRQALRLSTQVDRTVRQLKVTAVWGVQILLYPVYLLAQVGLAAGRQLSSGAPQGWPRLQEFNDKFTNQEDEQSQERRLEADTPILNVLQEVTTLPLPEIAGSGGAQSELLVALRERVSDNPTEVEQTTVTEPGQLSVSSESGLVQQPRDDQEASALSPSQSAIAPNGQRKAMAQAQTSEGYVIQGVACLLATRTLILVSIENQLLDILTAQQQEKLASKISWEVAIFLRQRRLAQSSNLKRAIARLSPQDSSPVLLPVKVFWQIMAWVQTSPVAIAANLFQEALLVGDEASNPLLPPRLAPQPMRQLPGSNKRRVLNQLLPKKAVVVVDRAIADLETHQLVPGTEALVKLRDSLRDRVTSRLESRRQQSETPSLSPNGQDVVTDTSQTHSFQIQALIDAAFAYFFGKRDTTLSGTNAQEQGQISSQPQQPDSILSGRSSRFLPPNRAVKRSQLDAIEIDPWLVENDLFGSSASIPQNSAISQGIEAQSPKQTSPAQLPEAFGSTITRPSIWDVLKGFLSRNSSAQEDTAIVRKPAVKRFLPYTRKEKLITIETTTPIVPPGEDKGSTLIEKHDEIAPQSLEPISLAQVQSSDLSIPSTPAQDSSIQPAPDWIETKAIPTGYVKHPLEQVLGWLDVAMLTVEDFVLKVWQWIWPRRD